MRKIIISVLAMCTLSACAGALPESLGGQARYEVYGVEEGDMLKLRSGPGTGHDVYVGLPNGTIVRAQSCERLGSTRWCKVTTDLAPGLVGYVSQSYLRKI